MKEQEEILQVKKHSINLDIQIISSFGMRIDKGVNVVRPGGGHVILCDGKFHYCHSEVWGFLYPGDGSVSSPVDPLERSGGIAKYNI